MARQQIRPDGLRVIKPSEPFVGWAVGLQVQRA